VCTALDELEPVARYTSCEAARISPAVLDRMKAAGVIQSDVRWREDLLKGGPINHQSMVNLLDKVNRLAEPTKIVDDATVTWAEFITRRMGEKHAIESLMKAILRVSVICLSDDLQYHHISACR
jgi:hypothetical protein